MHRFVAILLMAISGSALAQDKSYLIKNPSLVGFYFDYRSDQNGVCKSLGYEKAAVGSAVQNGVGNFSTLEANAEGIIERFGEVNEANGYSVAQIICVNKAVVPQGKRNTVVTNPVHSESQTAISSKSDLNGVCKINGFLGATGAKITNGRPVGPAVILDGNGNVVGGEVITSGSGFWISTLICLQ